MSPADVLQRALLTPGRTVWELSYERLEQRRLDREVRVQAERRAELDRRIVELAEKYRQPVQDVDVALRDHL